MNVNLPFLSYIECKNYPMEEVVETAKNSDFTHDDIPILRNPKKRCGKGRPLVPKDLSHPLKFPNLKHEINDIAGNVGKLAIIKRIARNKKYNYNIWWNNLLGASLS
ncbi:unnamed protein product [Rhizophagus irregularis]|nr:unnamed protein product [Rhizophagus irregularis]